MIRGAKGRGVAALLALAAAAALVAIVPVRDRCWDPRASASTRVAVSRGSAGCVLHLRSGDVAIDAAECVELRCEPGLASLLAHGWGAALGAGAFAGAFGAGVWLRRRRRSAGATPSAQ